MIRAALRGVWEHKLRTMLLGLAIVAGVSFVSAAFVFTDTIAAAFDGLFTEAFAGVDIAVAAARDEDDFRITETRFDESVVDTIVALDGVDTAYPSIGSFVQIIVDGEPIQTGGAPSFGGSWSDEPAGFEIREGRAPAGSGEVLLDAGTASNNGLAVGDVVEVAAGGPAEPVEVVGTVGFGSSDNLLGAAFVLFEFETAQRVFGGEGEVDSISVSVVDGADIDTVVDGINAAVPAGVEAVSAQSAAEEQAAEVREGLSFITVFLLVFAGIALFVGVFVVYNAFRTVVGQRSRELALFRVLGATRAQVVQSMVVEALVVGVLAAATGVLAGFGLAVLLELMLEAVFSSNLPDAPLQVLPRTVIVALTAGMVTTVASALIPAWRASRISPMEALREVEKPARALGARIGVTAALLGGGVLLSIVALLADWPLLVVGGGSLMIILGTYVAGSLIARPVIAFAGRPLRGRVTSNLATQNARRSPRRTAATAGALMVGVALVTAVAILTVTVQDTARAAIDDAFGADLLIQAEGFNPFTGVSPDIAPLVAALDEVEVVSPIRGGQARVGETVTFVQGVDPTTYPSVIAFEDVEGDFADLVGDSVAVQRIEADELGLAIGDEVTITVTGEAIAYEVVAIWDLVGSASDGNHYLIPYDTYGALDPLAPDLQVPVVLADGVEIEAGRTAIEEVVAAFPSATVVTQSDLLAQLEQQLAGFLGLIFGLLAMSVLVALIGVALTLLLSVFERTREIGLLRAVGMTQGQVRGMVRWESVIVALFGALLGVLVGLFLGWVLAWAIFGEGFTYAVPIGWVVLGFVAAAVAGLVAAWWPARRAAGLDILQAIAYE